MQHVDYETGDEKRKQMWRYWFDDRENLLVLDGYVLVERPSKRHNWRTIEGWFRQARLDTEQMKREDVPVPDEVRAEVLRKFRNMIMIEGD